MLGVCRGGPLHGESWTATGGTLSAGAAPAGGPDPGGCARGGADAPASASNERTLSGQEREAWAVLASISGLGPVGFSALLRRFGSGVALLEAARKPDGVRLMASDGDECSDEDSQDEACRARIAPELAARIAAAAIRSDGVLEGIRRLGLQTVTLEDAAYPARLLAVEMPPHVLFVRGDLGACAPPRAVAVVGTRRPSDHGRRVAARIAAAIARTGAGVVSGLAIGIDGAAHAAVVAERRPTIAVLGGGHEHLYPRAHRNLADVIVAEGGAVISELPPDAMPTRGTFPRRNRLISGLSDATVVVEAAPRSGALITAGWALEQGRECFIVPGPIDARTSAGCLAFLREYEGQARIVAGVPELLEDLGLVQADHRDGAAAVRRGTPNGGTRGPSTGAVLVELGAAEESVARELLAGRSSVDDLVGATGMSVGAVLGTLTLLEMRGLVVAAYGRYRPAGVLASSDRVGRETRQERR